MKPTGLALLLTAAVAQGDILTDTLPFLRAPGPDYTPENLAPSTGIEDASYAPYSPADSDLGVQEILGVTPEKAPVNLMVGLDLHYTDNAPATVGNSPDGSVLLASYVGISWQPLLQDGWFADIGFIQEFYEFEDGDAYDFENGMPYIGVVKTLVDWDDTLFFARYEYQRLTSGKLTESDYFAHRIRTGLQKTLFSASRQQLSGGISIAQDIDANPERLERREYSAELSYTYAINNSVSATTIARSSLWEFDDGGREDKVHVAGVELSYRLCERATATTSLFYTKNDSNSPFGAGDSQSWQGGLGLGVNYSF